MAADLNPGGAETLAAFSGKWRGHWPEWLVSEVFVPADQREMAVAWFALREELAEAAWAYDDPRPGEAKLLWWTDELHGWMQGRRRHPLGVVLQPSQAPWHSLAGCLMVLRAARELPADIDRAVALLEPYAEAVAGVSQSLFACERPPPARGVVLAQLAERCAVLARGGRCDPQAARAVLDAWAPISDGSRAGRLHAAMLRARLQGHAQGRDVPMPAWRMLPLAWRAARG